MRYKTYKGMNPNGLIKTLFVAREDDFDRYYEELSDKILSVQKSIAIYDYEDMSEVDDDFLSEMRLVIAPITMKFLRSSCKERTEIFDRARNMNIPVLPILEERGIEPFFNSICGEIQCISAVEDDNTALSFEKKLERFMDEVLIGEETTRKVREAFHAYIFLSYRKKDRKHAQEIMNLIHDNDFMRDVAIWYDEYLVAGESFNDSIRDALLKSQAMALVVTPNLVNEENYVQQVEYPMAVEAGKMVLPIEAVPTDAEAMKEKYSGIDDAINEENAEALTESLRRIFAAEATKTDDDPEHLFFIGLAYLMGIDVETNTKRGMDLITEAFSAGYERVAGPFLVNCYMEGRYVVADYLNARNVQEAMCVRYYDRFWGEDATEEYGREEILEFVDMLHKLVEIWILLDGYTEEALQNKANEVGFLELLDKEFPIKNVEFKDPDDPEVSEIKELYRDKFRIWKAKIEKMDMMTHMPDHRTDVEIVKTCMDIWDSMIAIGDKYHKYCIDWDIMRFAYPFSMACRYFKESDFKWSDMLPFSKVRRFFKDRRYNWFFVANCYERHYFDKLGQLTEEDFDECEESFKVFLSDLLFSMAQLEVEFISWINENYDGTNDEIYIDAGCSEPDHLESLEILVEDAAATFLEKGREYERDCFIQLYWNTLCDMEFNIKDYDKAYEFINYAISNLEDKCDTHPNLLLQQMKNYEKLIKIGEKLDDLEIQKNAYTELIRKYEDYDEFTGGNVTNAPDIWEHVRILKEKGIELDITI